MVVLAVAVVTIGLVARARIVGSRPAGLTDRPPAPADGAGGGAPRVWPEETPGPAYEPPADAGLPGAAVPGAGVPGQAGAGPVGPSGETPAGAGGRGAVVRVDPAVPGGAVGAGPAPTVSGPVHQPDPSVVTQPAPSVPAPTTTLDNGRPTTTVARNEERGLLARLLNRISTLTGGLL
jgi:hypothetical protein